MVWVCLLIAIVATGSLLYFYLPFRRTPEKRWRDAVGTSRSAAQARLAKESAELRELPQRREVDRRSLTQGAFDRYLKGIAVGELEAYPGIGPATVGRLRQAGYGNLAKLRTAHIRVKGLGAKRLADIRRAVRQLVGEAENRFRAGAGREAQPLAVQLQGLEAKYASLESRAQARAGAATAVLRQLEEPAAIARRLTFWNYVWNNPSFSVPAELLEQPLSDLGAALREVAQVATQADDRRRVKGDPAPPSAIPVARPADGATPSIQPSAGPPSNEAAETLLEMTVAFAFAVARTDGSVAGKERALIDDRFRQLYGADPTKYNRVMAFSAHYETAPIDVEACIQRIKDQAPFAEREKLVAFGGRIAEAAGPMNQREVRFLQRTAREWGVPWTPPVPATGAAGEATKRAALPDGPPPVPDPPVPGPDPRALLEIEADVPLTAELIRRHYNSLSARLAPEKAQQMGPEFLAMALRKRQAVRAAAEVLMEPFGEPLELPDAPAGPAELRHNPDLDAMFGV